MKDPADGRVDIAAFLLRMRAVGISDKRLLTAIESTPREDFIPGRWRNAAYCARMIPIDCGEAIEGIDLQAQVLSLLDIQKSHRVLEIGTGSGFTAAVMARLSERVTTIDRFATLCDSAQHRFETLELANVVAKHLDGYGGLQGEGPFDRIVSWVAFDGMPRPYVELLSGEGVMVAPIGAAGTSQVLARLTKVGSRFEREDITNVRLQPVKEGLAAVL